jgi:hypothetical protein
METSVYVKYSARFPYLPEAVGDTAAEIGRSLGVCTGNIYSAISKKCNTVKKVRIISDDEESQIKMKGIDY